MNTKLITKLANKFLTIAESLKPQDYYDEEHSINETINDSIPNYINFLDNFREIKDFQDEKEIISKAMRRAYTAGNDMAVIDLNTKLKLLNKAAEFFNLCTYASDLNYAFDAHRHLMDFWHSLQ